MPWISRIGGPLPRLVNATLLSRQSKPPSSPPIRLVSWSTSFRAKALLAAAAPRIAPPDRRILRQGPCRSSLSCITPHFGQPRGKRGYLESNRALGTAHGGRGNCYPSASSNLNSCGPRRYVRVTWPPLWKPYLRWLSGLRLYVPQLSGQASGHRKTSFWLIFFRLKTWRSSWRPSFSCRWSLFRLQHGFRRWTVQPFGWPGKLPRRRMCWSARPLARCRALRIPCSTQLRAGCQSRSCRSSRRRFRQLHRQDFRAHHRRGSTPASFRIPWAGPSFLLERLRRRDLPPHPLRPLHLRLR